MPLKHIWPPNKGLLQKQQCPIYWSYFNPRSQGSHCTHQDSTGSRFSYQWPASALCHTAFPNIKQSKHLSLFPGTLLPDVHITKWMFITRSMCQHRSWEWRAQDLWKGKELFCFRHCKAPGGVWAPSLPVADLPCCSSERFSSSARYLVSPINGFSVEMMEFSNSWICLKQSGALTYKQKSEWQINSWKTIFMKLKVQFFRNTDDPYQYISDNSAASCSRLDFLSLLYHPFYLILA